MKFEELEYHRKMEAAALAAGWVCEKVLLCPESECVEGYRWTGPAGQELYSYPLDGDAWYGAEVPDEILRLVDPERKKASEQKREFAEFVGKLMSKGA